MSSDLVPPNEGEERPREKKSFDLVSILVEKVTGTVKWFSVPRHYGFIQRDDNNEDVFVHRNSITASKQRFPTLKSGEPVEFSIVETVSGVNADSVTGPEGKPVKGTRRYMYRAPNPSKSPGVSDVAPNAAGEESASQPNEQLAEGTPINGIPRQIRRPRRRGFGRRPQQLSRGDDMTGYENEVDGQPRDGVSPPDGAPLPRPRPRRGRGRFMGGRFASNGPRPFPPYEGPDQQQLQQRPSWRGRRPFGRGRRPPRSYDNFQNHGGDDSNINEHKPELVNNEEHPLEKEMVNLTLDDLKEVPGATSPKCDATNIENPTSVVEDQTAELETEMS